MRDHFLSAIHLAIAAQTVRCHLKKMSSMVALHCLVVKMIDKTDILGEKVVIGAGGGSGALADARVLYHGTVRRLSFKNQVQAAAQMGCRSLTIGPNDFRILRDSGLSARDLLEIASDGGVALTHLDPFVRWVPDWMPQNVIPDFSAAVLDCDEDELFAIAEALGVQSVTVGASFSAGHYSVPQMIDAFGGLCERTARHGLRCDLEFVPFSGVSDLSAAWAIVEGAGAANSGIMFDVWHYVRSGSSSTLLRSIEGKWITGVQVSDGVLPLPFGRSLIEDSMNYRLPPGEGDFPLNEILGDLESIGGLNRMGFEIFSREFDQLSVNEIAARCSASFVG